MGATDGQPVFVRLKPGLLGVRYARGRLEIEGRLGRAQLPLRPRVATALLSLDGVQSVADTASQLSGAELTAFRRAFTALYATHCLEVLDGPGGDPGASRYSRQTAFLGLFTDRAADELQKRLATLRVLIVGVGGIGSNVAGLLAGAGVNHLVLVDGDCVEASNLNRQTLFRVADIGQRKVDVCRRELSALNPNVRITAVPRHVGARLPEAVAMLPIDLTVAAMDTSSVRQTLQKECVEREIPFSMCGYLGERGVVGPLLLPGRTACAGCGGGEEPLLGVHRTNGAPAVRLVNASYGPLNYLVAAVQADEIIRWATGYLPPLTIDHQQVWNLRNGRAKRIRIVRDVNCRWCGRR